MTQTNINLLMIIVSCGIVGGIGNSLRENAVDTKTYIKNIFLGIIASTTVPLFLQILSSKIISSVEIQKDPLNYFVFSGFCIIAAFSSITFLTSMSGRVLQNIKEEIKVLKNENETLKTESIRLDTNLNAIAINEEKINTNIDIDKIKQPEIIEVMTSIQNDGKNFRPIDTIKNEVSQENKDIDKTITILKDNNLIKEYTLNDGSVAIALSQEAEQILNESK